MPRIPSGRLSVDVRAQPRPPATTVAGRVRDALRCPYCHDAVDRSGGLACGRRACGALYHAACWDECVSHYGGCAVMGCGMGQARGLGRVGLWWRVARLVVAALLFPPRVLKVLQSDDVDVEAIRHALEDKAREADDAFWARGPAQHRVGAGTRFVWNTIQLVVPLAAMAAAFAAAMVASRASPQGAVVGLVVAVAAGVASVLLMHQSTRGLALFIYMARAILAGEAAALARAGGGYLERMRKGGGKK